jgi:acyl-CoA synthetase (AMP-forming)/AMP-acid ligase II
VLNLPVTADARGLNIEALLELRCSDPRPAIVDGTGKGVTWAEVAEQAARWKAAELTGPIGLALRDPVAMALNFVAALRAGAIVVPLDPGAPLAETASRVAVLGVEGIVSDPQFEMPAGITAWSAGRGHLEPAAQPAPGKAFPERRVARLALPPEPVGVAALLASSGTTGTPKVVPLTERQLLLTAEAVADSLGLEPDDRGYSPLPLFHINGLVVGVLSALVAGSSIALDGQFSRRRFWDAATCSGATWLNLVPAILSILGDPDSPPPQSASAIRLARSASAPLPGAVLRRFERRTGIPVVETYGMTEAASQITANPPDAVRRGSVGLASSVELRVVPSSGGGPGRVQIRGERVTSHYWTMTADGWACRPAREADGWLDTGDLGWLDQAGYLHLAGREGEVINRGGEKIHPREVEEVILADPRVAVAVVVARPDPIVGEAPVAVVVPSERCRSTAGELARDIEERCAATLSRYKRPVEIRVEAPHPAGPTGKVRRSQVKTIVAQATEPSTAA